MNTLFLLLFGREIKALSWRWRSFTFSVGLLYMTRFFFSSSSFRDLTALILSLSAALLKLNQDKWAPSCKPPNPWSVPGDKLNTPFSLNSNQDCRTNSSLRLNEVCSWSDVIIEFRLFSFVKKPSWITRRMNNCCIMWHKRQSKGRGILTYKCKDGRQACSPYAKDELILTWSWLRRAFVQGSAKHTLFFSPVPASLIVALVRHVAPSLVPNTGHKTHIRTHIFCLIKHTAVLHWPTLAVFLSLSSTQKKKKKQSNFTRTGFNSEALLRLNCCKILIDFKILPHHEKTVHQCSFL